MCRRPLSRRIWHRSVDVKPLRRYGWASGIVQTCRPLQLSAPRANYPCFRVILSKAARMGIARPYRRTCRQLADGSYAGGGNGQYVKHAKYAREPGHYVRAFQLIQGDMLKLFEYVEPSNKNLECYSYRIHELLLRACVEVEANCKAILLENGYPDYSNQKGCRDLNMFDYMKINGSHHMSDYEVKAPFWREGEHVVVPFENWSAQQPLPWYQAYNKTKHDRHTKFALATFDEMLNAICGLVAIISAQFRDEDFSGHAGVRVVSGPNDGFEQAVGGRFRVKYPTWPDDERYSLDWQKVAGRKDPFQNYPYKRRKK